MQLFELPGIGLWLCTSAGYTPPKTEKFAVSRMGFLRVRWCLGYCAILGNLEVRKVTDRTRTATPDTYRSASVNFSSGWDTGAEDVALERGAIGFPSLKRNILESNDTWPAPG